MIYAIPYVILICVFFFFALWYEATEREDTRRGIVAACIAIIIFFFGFRGFVFYDWNSYYPAFQALKIEDLQSLPIDRWPFEPGFSILMIICKNIINEFSFFVLVCTIIDTALLIHFLKKCTSNIPLALIVCFSMNCLLFFTDLMRNSISILIFANATVFIERKQPFYYIGACLLAATFHATAFFYLPLYFFLNRKINRWVYLSIFILGNIVYLLHISVFLYIVEFIAGFISDSLQLKIKTYMEFLPNAGFQISIGYLERLLTGILLFCYMNKLRMQQNGNNIYINTLIIYLVLFFFLSEFKVISLRLAYLFTIGYWVVWLDLLKCFTIDNNRKLYLAFLCLYSILKIYSSTDNIIARYDNVLFGAQPFHIREYIYNKHFNDD